MVRFAIAVTVLLSALGVAAPAGATQLVRTAPGRELIAVTGGATVRGMGWAGATGAVALPDGDVIAVGGATVMAAGEGFYLADITRSGPLNPAFGRGGIAHVAAADAVVAQQVLRRPDGRLLVLADGAPGPHTAPAGTAEVFGLEPDGSVDPSWGTAGVVELGVSYATGALDGAGNLVMSEVVQTDTTDAWLVQRLTPTGAPDATFGTGGTATIQPPTAGVVGRSPGIAVGPDGRIFAVAATQAATRSAPLVALRPDGTIDPSFAGGAPVATAPGFAGAPVVERNGVVDVASGGEVSRYDAAGRPITVFGVSTAAPTAGPIGLFANDDGSLLFADNVGLGGTIVPWTVSPTNIAHNLPRVHAIDAGGQEVELTGVVRRADGSYLAIGGAARVVSGDGGISDDGTSAFDFVAVGLTPAFAIDPTFGGPAAPITAHVRIEDPTVKEAHHTHAIHVTAWTSTFSQSRLSIYAHGRLIARAVSPLASGMHTGTAPLTAFGRGYLATHHGVRVTATFAIDDVLLRKATATASATLR